MANYENLTKDLNNQQVADLKAHVDAVAQNRRKKISLESIRPGMSAEHESDIRAEILRVLRETQG